MTDRIASLWKRIADWFDRPIALRTRVTYSSSTPMTEAQRAAFNTAFAKMDEAFKELEKAVNHD